MTPPLCVLLVVAVFASTLFVQDPKRPGYRDTELIPGTRWRVHDADRPYPPKVTPGASFAAPPSDAVVLFDGSDLSQWRGPKGDARWKLVDGAMEVNGTGDIRSREEFGDCQLHVEWLAPEEDAEGQGRGNSGVFLCDRYEIQVLESHGSETYADGQAAALYGQRPPDVNACRPAGEWQSFDIVFEVPRFAEDGTLLSPAYATVFHNGVLVHNHAPMLGITAHRDLARYAPHPPAGPIRLQDHGNPVRFRNVWVRQLD